MSRYLLTAFAALVIFVAGAPVATAYAHGSEAHAAESAGAAETPAPAESLLEKARDYFTDLPVITQDGETKRFFSDLLKDKVVLVTLFYSECTGMCPIINQKIAKVQDLVGDRLGKSIIFVSVSLDPKTDTPEVLKDYAAKFGARDGWYFVTGKEEDLKTIAYRLGQADDNIAAHNPYVMVGSTRRARWKKFRPNVADAMLAVYLDDLASGS